MNIISKDFKRRAEDMGEELGALSKKYQISLIVQVKAVAGDDGLLRYYGELSMKDAKEEEKEEAGEASSKEGEGSSKEGEGRAVEGEAEGEQAQEAFGK